MNAVTGGDVLAGRPRARRAGGHCGHGGEVGRRLRAARRKRTGHARRGARRSRGRNDSTAGIEHARATRSGIITGITVVPVSVVKGLELDGVVVVEPAAIVSGELQGLRALYVALTRSTRRLTVVHADDLPASMR